MEPPPAHQLPLHSIKNHTSFSPPEEQPHEFQYILVVYCREYIYDMIVSFFFREVADFSRAATLVVSSMGGISGLLAGAPPCPSVGRSSGVLQPGRTSRVISSGVRKKKDFMVIPVVSLDIHVGYLLFVLERIKRLGKCRGAE